MADGDAPEDRRTLTAAKLAERLGFSQLYNLDGGTSGWVKAGLPLEQS
ncbi:rhodanese-like domain-containing protein [Sorangium sp. So ce385]